MKGSDRALALLIVAAALSLLAASAMQSPLTPVQVAAADTFTEGPVFDYSGDLYFSSRTAVIKLSKAGKLTTWLSGADAGYHGHKILPDGTHLICAAKKGAVLKFSNEARLIRVVASECGGKPLRAPNDLTLDSHGGFYFTDPGGSREAPIGTVHYVDVLGKAHLSASGMRVPNGLVLTPNGRRLYVAETQRNRILWFEVLAPGKLRPLGVFANLPSRDGHAAEPDGLAMDKAGNLYVAHLGMSAVQVLDPGGALLRSLPAGVYDASNLVFGGPGNSQLFITGSTGHRARTPGRVYRLNLPDVEGISPLLPRR